jgi:hypothetical protein
MITIDAFGLTQRAEEAAEFEDAVTDWDEQLAEAIESGKSPTHKDLLGKKVTLSKVQVVVVDVEALKKKGFPLDTLWQGICDYVDAQQSGGNTDAFTTADGAFAREHGYYLNVEGEPTVEDMGGDDAGDAPGGDNGQETTTS